MTTPPPRGWLETGISPAVTISCARRIPAEIPPAAGLATWLPEPASPMVLPANDAPLNEVVLEDLPLQEPAHPNELVRPIVIEGSRPLRDLLVDPALLRNWLQVVDSAAGLRDLPLLKPVPGLHR